MTEPVESSYTETEITEDRTNLRILSVQEIKVPIPEIPSETLDRLNKMRLPKFGEAAAAIIGVITVIDSISRILSDQKPGGELIEAIAGTILVGVGWSLWAKRDESLSQGERRMRENLVMLDTSDPMEDLINPY